MYSLRIGAAELQLVEGDITAIAVDAMVNAANAQLAGGGGVDGAIHAAGGASIMRELDAIRKAIGSCLPGKAVATGAGRLPAKYVFHAVGPIYRGGAAGEPAQLAACYQTCLDMAAERKLGTISFPSISTGVYSYPLPAAAQVALASVMDWLASHPTSVKLVKLVQFSAKDHALYCKVARQLAAGQQATSG